MYYDLMGPTYAEMRRHANLDVEDVGEALGRSPRTIQRLEANERKIMLKREQEEKLFEITRTSKQLFGKIAAGTLGSYIGRTVVVLPPDTLIPSLDLLLTFKMFARHGHKLDLEERLHIEGLLDEARSLDATAERVCKAVAREVVWRINKARIAFGEDPSKDPEDWPWIDGQARREHS